jgi:hypothetical protein
MTDLVGVGEAAAQPTGTDSMSVAVRFRSDY